MGANVSAAMQRLAVIMKLKRCWIEWKLQPGEVKGYCRCLQTDRPYFILFYKCRYSLRTRVKTRLPRQLRWMLCPWLSWEAPIFLTHGSLRGSRGRFIFGFLCGLLCILGRVLRHGRGLDAVWSFGLEKCVTKTQFAIFHSHTLLPQERSVVVMENSLSKHI